MSSHRGLSLAPLYVLAIPDPLVTLVLCSKCEGDRKPHPGMVAPDAPLQVVFVSHCPVFVIHLPAGWVLVRPMSFDLEDIISWI